MVDEQAAERVADEPVGRHLDAADHVRVMVDHEQGPAPRAGQDSPWTFFELGAVVRDPPAH